MNCAKVLERVRAKAMAKVVCVALVDGKRVVQVCRTMQEANVALCVALDVYFDENPTAKGHTFDIVGLNVVPSAGSILDGTTHVFIP